MAKRIALLISLVMMFSLSCVFAADLAAAPDTTSEVISGEVANEDNTNTDSVEAVSGETSTEVSGEANTNTEVSGNVESGDVNETVTPEHNHDAETDSNGNNTVVGAIIAIVIVVAVVAIVSVLQKK